MFAESTQQPAEPHRVRPAQETVRAARVRLRGGLVAAACAGVLAAAGCLSPSRDGFGTHQQLGLPTCSFLARTGWPCPTCGVTTSVAEAARGRLFRAWHAHPFGVLVAAGLAALGAAGLCELATGRPSLPAGRRALLLAGLFAVLGLGGGWAWKLAAGAMSGEWPLR